MAKEISDFKSTDISGLSDVVGADRVHIGFFGRCNVGKSSVVNKVLGQKMSVVSHLKGTTTDPVKKAMELLPLGPVVIFDTPGFDDETEIGELRIKKMKEVLAKIDVAVLVIDGTFNKGQLTLTEKNLLEVFESKNIPYIIAKNKKDSPYFNIGNTKGISVSGLTGDGIDELKKAIGILGKNKIPQKTIFQNLVNKKDVVVLVTPIDSSAPKGRLILPQVKAIRDLLDNHCITIITQVEELRDTIELLKESPKIVVTDSQAFNAVKNIIPKEIPLTSFSILFARLKGILDTALKGIDAIKTLEDGDKVLISEGCSHHKQCEDIGSVKIPGCILKLTGKKLDFEFTSGGTYPEDLSGFSLIIHCGGCMLNETEMKYRMDQVENQNIAFINYGIFIAHYNDILKRSIEFL
ncbi:MAG: [FeFe] hydrogenase H-cluster maturation GTPase HydF [Eubacteriales bacterium]|nr:[FeFe] hydrogenase H-cluster maturation GTPase HydF [Eubacteriales bacterium]